MRKEGHIHTHKRTHTLTHTHSHSLTHTHSYTQTLTQRRTPHSPTVQQCQGSSQSSADGRTIHSTVLIRQVYACVVKRRESRQGSRGFEEGEREPELTERSPACHWRASLAVFQAITTLLSSNAKILQQCPLFRRMGKQHFRRRKGPKRAGKGRSCPSPQLHCVPFFSLPSLPQGFPGADMPFNAPLRTADARNRPI